MCTCIKDINLKVLAAKPKIEKLFLAYGIVSEVTVENVNLALEEEEQDFEQELTEILQNVKLVNNSGDDDRNKGEKALTWINTIGGITTGITGSFMGGKNGGSLSSPPPPPPEKSNTTTIVIIAVVAVILLGAVAWLATKK